MLLAVTATELEMVPLLEKLGETAEVATLIIGMGPVESTLRLSSYLTEQQNRINGIVNFGVGGSIPGSGLNLLDICLAHMEVFGDLGICTDEGIQDFERNDLPFVKTFSLHNQLVNKTERFLAKNNVRFATGPFVTVCCVSGTEKRGVFFRNRYGAICENMEGAAVARVCMAHNLPLLEIRAISNKVEKRAPEKWKLFEAADKCSYIVKKVLKALTV